MLQDNLAISLPASVSFWGTPHPSFLSLYLRSLWLLGATVARTHVWSAVSGRLLQANQMLRRKTEARGYHPELNWRLSRLIKCSTPIPQIDPGSAAQAAVAVIVWQNAARVQEREQRGLQGGGTEGYLPGFLCIFVLMILSWGAGSIIHPCESTLYF